MEIIRLPEVKCEEKEQNLHASPAFPKKAVIGDFIITFLEKILQVAGT